MISSKKYLLIFVYLVLIISSNTVNSSDDIDEINQKIKILENKQKLNEANLKEWSKQRDHMIESNRNIDGINASVVKELNKAEVDALKEYLSKFHCIGNKHTSIVDNGIACKQVHSCNNVYDCPTFGSAGPFVREIFKKMRVDEPASNPRTMEQYNKLRQIRSRLFHTLDYETHIRKANADVFSNDKKLYQLRRDRDKINNKIRKKYKQACSKLLNQIDGKVLSNDGQRVLSLKNMTRSQVNDYISELHTGMNEAEALPPGPERIEFYRNLRNLAEAISCNGYQKNVRNKIKELNEDLLISYEKSQNTDCKTANLTDRKYNEYLSCTENYLNNLPSALRQLDSDVSKIRSFLIKKNPSDILDKIAKDQIDNAIENLAQIDVNFDLGRNLCNWQNFYNENNITGSYDRSKYAARRCEGALREKSRTRNASKNLINCGNDRLKQAQEQFKIKMEDILKKYQYSGEQEQRDQAIKQDTYNVISEVSEMYPEIAPLVYSPTFIYQAEVDLDDATMEFKPSDCRSIKSGLRDALLSNINTIASPHDSSKLKLKEIAKTSQKSKRYLRSLFEITNDHSKYSDDIKKLDELYSEIPELRSYSSSDIFHLKSILKFRPELRSHYMREFEGNASLICHLFKSMKKDNMRDKIIEQETKFIKGVAKAVGATVAVASFFVNPAVGYFLTGIALGTSTVSNMASIALIEKKLNDVKNNQGKTIVDCTEELMKQSHLQTTSKDLIQKNCSDAVTAMMTASELKQELSTALKMSAAEAALYVAYLIRLGPQAVESANSMIGKGAPHHHHFKSWKEIASKQLPMKQKILESAKTIGHGDKTYGALKVMKATYYMANTPKIAYVFSDPLRNGYYYATLEEKVHEKLVKKNSNELSDREYKIIQEQVKKQISSMSEKQIISSIM